MSNRKVQVYFDLLCPYCYLGKGYMDEYAKNKDFEVEWISWEIHPEYPPQGRDITPKTATMRLVAMGEPIGRTFGTICYEPNTKLALQAVVEANIQGHGDAFIESMFGAHFREGKNMGDMDVILDCANRAGMDTQKTRSALEAGTHAAALEENDRVAENVLHLEVVPSFVIDGRLVMQGSATMTWDEFKEKADAAF